MTHFSYETRSTQKRSSLNVITIIFCLLSIVKGVAAETVTAHSLEQQFDKLISTYWRDSVTIHGIRTTVFDFKKMANDAKKSDSLFDNIQSSLENFNPGVLKDEAEAKAFWIDAYNFGAMQLVVDNYPVDSIRSFKISLLKNPWSKKSLTIGDRNYSLTEIEKEILLEKYNDPRILFAVSCAAVSCPDRTPHAFKGDVLNKQLDDMIRLFFTNEGKGFKLDKETKHVSLSWILDKDRQHFVEDDTSDQALMEFVKPYLDTNLRTWLSENEVTIDFLHHNWTLNDLAQKDE